MGQTESEWPEMRIHRLRSASVAVQLGGAAFLVFGLVAAVIAWVQSGDVLGATLTDQLLVTTRPLAVAGLGLLTLAVGMMLGHMEHMAQRSS